MTNLFSFGPCNQHMSKTSQLFETNTFSNLLDELQSTDDNLPSPMKPTNLLCDDYHGFSVQGSTIPTIPCSTGDLSVNMTSETSKCNCDVATYEN